MLIFKRKLLVIQLSNVIPRMPPRKDRVGTSTSRVEEADTDPEDETERLCSDEVFQHVQALDDEIHTHLGNRLGITVDTEGLFTLVRCHLVDLVLIKNKIQAIVEDFHRRVFREILKRKCDPSFTLWVPDYYNDEVAHILTLFKGEGQNIVKRSLLDNPYPRLVARPFKEFFSEFMVMETIIQSKDMKYPEPFPYYVKAYERFPIPPVVLKNFNLDNLMIFVSCLAMPEFATPDTIQQFPKGYYGTNHVSVFIMQINPVPNFDVESMERLERVNLFMTYLKDRCCLVFDERHPWWLVEDFKLEMVIFEKTPLNRVGPSPKLYKPSKALREKLKLNANSRYVEETDEISIRVDITENGNPGNEKTKENAKRTLEVPGLQKLQPVTREFKKAFGKIIEQYEIDQTFPKSFEISDGTTTLILDQSGVTKKC